MSILFFCSDYRIGLSSLLTRQLLSLHEAGVEVLPVSGEQEQEAGLRQRLKHEGLQPVIIKGLDEHSNFWSLIDSLAHLIAENQIDVCHVQNNWQLTLMAVCKWKTGSKFRILYTLHGFRHNSPIKSKIARWVIGLFLLIAADRVIYMSSYVRHCFSFLGKKLVYHPLLIDESFYLSSRRPDLRERGILAVFPAQFRSGKNQDMLIRTVAHLVKGGCRIHLTLPGDGPLLCHCTELSEALGIGTHVSFPGRLDKDHLIACYEGCNVSIISSNTETFGQSIVESMATGCLVVSRPVGIAADIIEHGKNGFIFRDEQELQDILTDLCSGHYDARSIADAGRRTAEQFRGKFLAPEYAKIIDCMRRS